MVRRTGRCAVQSAAENKVFQYGYLLTWQHFVLPGNDDRNTVNGGGLSALVSSWHVVNWAVVLIFVQRGSGLNQDNDNYSIDPLGIGIGKVFKKEKTVY